MSEARAITNVIGNAVATVVVAKSENAFNEMKQRSVIEGEMLVLAEPG
jgi:aerobic C4-dicarboxylate transport protein